MINKPLLPTAVCSNGWAWFFPAEKTQTTIIWVCVCNIQSLFVSHCYKHHNVRKKAPTPYNPPYKSFPRFYVFLPLE